MKIDYSNPVEKIITYRLGKSLVKITEKKDLSKIDDKLESDFRSMDMEVRNHEQTHLAALGPYANGVPGYITVTGPDGRAYAGGGYINVDLSPVPGDPEASLQKANTILYASLAPGNPSGADKNVADMAFSMALQARKEIDSKYDREPGNNDPLGIYKENLLKTGTNTGSSIDLIV
jgi:hypothetical protein